MNKEIEEMVKAGTGKIPSLAKTITQWQQKGYSENLRPCYDHFALSSDQKLYPDDFFVDEIIRFENLSDPSDQSILYAISSKNDEVRGLFVESYGLYHPDLSPEMLNRIVKSRAAHTQ